MTKYIKMRKRKTYPTWVSRRIKGCKIYILQVVKENPYFHFQIMCYDDVKYASLVDNIIFTDFDECCQAAEKWIADNHQ